MIILLYTHHSYQQYRYLNNFKIHLYIQYLLVGFMILAVFGVNHLLIQFVYKYTCTTEFSIELNDWSANANDVSVAKLNSKSDMMTNLMTDK